MVTKIITKIFKNVRHFKIIAKIEKLVYFPFFNVFGHANAIHKLYFIYIIKFKLYIKISKWPLFSKWLPKWYPKSRKSINSLLFNLFCHAVHKFMFTMSNSQNLQLKNSKQPLFSKWQQKSPPKSRKCHIPHLSLYLATQKTNFMPFDIKSRTWSKNFKMADFLKMAAIFLNGPQNYN